MESHPNEKEAEHAVAALIETYRQGFLHLDPEQIASIWDSRIVGSLFGRAIYLRAPHAYPHSHSIVPGGFDVTS
jgi:hypothetical protein